MVEVMRASAGCGKTHQLVNKTLSLIESGLNPEKILIFTFTVNAKDELRKRLTNAGNVRIETMHSLFLSLLKKIDSERYSKIISESEKESFFLRFLLENKLTRKFKYIKIKPRDIIMFIGLAKNLYIKPIGKLMRNLMETRQSTIFNVDKLSLEKHYKRVCDISRLDYNDDTGEIDHYSLAMFDSLYFYYEKNKGCIDFDDMLVEMYDALLENRGNIKELAQNSWDYILIDEFQDTNSLQVEIIKIMYERHKNLFIIGDWKQSIYEWRGGNYTILRDIHEWFPNPEVSSLKKTFRNSKSVLHLANHISQYLLGDEVIETNSTKEGAVNTLSFFSKEEEALYISERIAEINDENETAFVLTRTNAHLVGIEMFLLMQKIPYYISCISILQSEMALDIACMLYMVTTDSFPAENTLRRFFKFVGVYISKKDKEQYFKTKSYENFEPHVKEIFEKAKNTLSELRNLYCDMIESDSLNITELARECFTKLNYSEYLSTIYTRQEFDDNLEIIQNFISTLHIFKSLEELFKLMMSKSRNDPKENIKLLTIHASKGLEAKTVFLAGMTNGVFPNSKSFVSDEHTEAEKRLLYVAVTRAEEYLIATHYGDRGNYFSYISDVSQKYPLTKNRQEVSFSQREEE